ncbi:ATP-dependent RNA helicase DbpA [Saccharobesus litoralis]|uniref:ATP-dependent RNA helicase DbpA n=1 Tax=Saccharobesus litoralis TaxID=2172099 RepID=A0A2S0VVW5_9ALTE|nr:ATP-dependent RNA helicase DbpA [Saccharobesus litoralis]AWB68250.1 ATP-dependent RNA helicase DbpA [Saccharobesus litoralis]
MSQLAFSNTQLKTELVSNLDTLGYKEMTAIQAQSLPAILQGKDVIAQGKTGSGKTAAFGLGLLNKLDVKRFRIQTLILCPTRELADQVAVEIRKLARAIHNIKVLTLTGGMPFAKQQDSLYHGAHIIVGTPGRIDDHLNRGTLNLNDVDTLVLDEADRMLEMGFQDTLTAIVERTPIDRQTLLFSATYPDAIKTIANNMMRDAVMVQVEDTHDDTSIAQHFYQTADSEAKLHALRLLLLQHQPESSVVFCNTKRDTLVVCDELNRYGFHALALNGDLEQRERDQTLVQFANKSASILVATDVAARGLDVENLDAVFNYDFAHDTDTHTHRVGRTGRAGNKGLACTFFTEKDAYKIEMLAELLQRDINAEALPRESVLDNRPNPAPMVTLQIDSGKKQKIRKGDILGALTGENGIEGKQVGKIQVNDTWSFVAVERAVAKRAINKLSQGKMKGRNRRVRQLS